MRRFTTVTSGLLEGVRVLDLSMHLSGPYGSMVLADMGAEVIKVEPPTGDPQRLLEPTKHQVPVIWASINRNKRSVVIDLRTDAGRDVFLELVAKSDVVFNNYRPHVLDRLGLDFETLKAANPQIIVGNLTGYGLTGPKSMSPAYDTAIQALSGGMSLTGHPGAPPARAGVPISDLIGGMFLDLSVIGALRKRDRTGKPVVLDISLFESSLSLLMYWAGMALNTGVTPQRQGSGNTHVYPYGAFPANDGWIVVAPYSGAFWPKLCVALSRQDLRDDPRFVDNDARVANRDELEAILNKEFRRRTSEEWLAILRDADVPAAPVNTVGQAMTDPQVAARGMRADIPIGDEVFSFAGNPVRTYPETAASYGPPPRFGEHTRAVLTEVLGMAEEKVTELANSGVLYVEDVHGARWVGLDKKSTDRN
ncbi:MAG: CoA transferase [Actinophytocola sp.]|uniref:CaiB/BaiF CoA transferase family protein n=1 Tax=Actinophytocola sp. TaxID=1872138 RepID=UPI0013297198|nr:CoA transferase [Actinophytocola sp.]MPZ80065.1 CoA transferase [Actinophytocola sp.]